jgi:alanine racemase
VVEKLMRPTKAIVRLDAIAHNYRLAKRLTPASKNIAVIKANAYGHGMLEVARELERDVPAFAVAFMDEAVQLREAGIGKPILVMQGASHASDIAQAAANDFWLMLHDQQQTGWVLSENPAEPVTVWLKVDTGMHRFGLAPVLLDEICMKLQASPNVRQEIALCTHLACADDLDNPMTGQQVRALRSCAGKYNLALSIANSAGILCWPETHAEWNRPGYMLYGNSPMSSTSGESFGLLPAMTMSSEIVAIRELQVGDGVGYGHDWVAERPTRVGTIPIGYGDGYPRHAPSGTPVLVNGQRVPLVGRVSMDAISVDLTDIKNARIGDPVELWGQGICVNEVAQHAGTIGYEILAGLTGRAPIIYKS